MKIAELKRLLMFVTLCLAQALVFNHIRLFDCATPLLYVYFAIIFPRSYPRWAALLWCFFLGLSIDMFSNTPGMAAASLTLIGFLQPYVIELFIPRDAAENQKSSAESLGFTKFHTMSAILVLIFCLVYFSLEAFSFFNWLQWLLNIVGSALLTVALIMALEAARRP